MLAVQTVGRSFRGTTLQPTPQNSGSTITLKLPRLHDAQLQIKRERARFNVLDCGRRFGKDILQRDLLVEPALQGYPVAWIEPSFPMMVEVWPDLVRLLRPITSHRDASEHRLELITGGTVKLWSLEAYDAARGKKYKRLIFNEAAMSAHLQAAWQEVFRATLTDYLGDAFFGSTPKGRNYFFQLFSWGMDPERKDWKAWKMPTSRNPHISLQEIEDARRDLPERTFAQEYLAEFNEDGGAVFRRVRGCVYTEEPAKPPKKPEELQPGETQEKRAYIMGCDWGRSNDFTWLTVMDMQTKRVVYMERFNQIDWAFQRERLKSVFHKWGCEVVVAENNSIGEPNIEALVADDIPVFPFQTTNASKATVIERLVLAIENKTVSYPDDPELIAELEAFEMGRTKLGAVTYSAPEGQHDDGVMSLALALWGCQ
jgi:hypothetical protein